MRRLPELDALRGLAAVSIVAYHLWFPKLMHGWTRVDLFFVLSGYLVTDLILRRSGPEGFLRTFYLRRCLRIAPPYFAALGVLLASRAFVPHHSSMAGLPFYLTFTQNVQHFWNGRVPGFNPHFFHTWSLALDVRFYLIWPPLLLVAGRRPLVPIAMALIAAPALGRAWGVSEFILPGRCDGFGWGVLLAAVLSDRRGPAHIHRRLGRAFAGLILAGTAILAFGMYRHWGTLTERAVPWPWLAILASNMAYAGLVGSIVVHGGHPALAFLRCRALVHLGAISYGLYLFHPLAFMGVEVAAGRAGFTRGLGVELAMLAASLVAAELSWIGLERPMARVKSAVSYGDRAADRPSRDGPGGASGPTRSRAVRLTIRGTPST